MLYEPVKDRLIRLAKRSQLLRRFYYVMLNAVFLRSWYVRRTIRAIIAQHGGEPVRVLDAGTGLGQFAFYIASLSGSVRVHAVDINEEYLEYARRFISKTRCAPRVTYGVEDLTDLKTAGPYDVILSVDVMEHIEQDVEVFRQFARVLRTGGRVVINTPSDLGGSDVQEAGDESFIGEHVRDGYGREELSSKLESAGFEIERVTYTYGRWGSLAWRLLIKIPMQLIAVSPILLVAVVPYFLLVLPVGLLLNALDTATDNDSGTGILVVARKCSEPTERADSR
jgi:2-polyprenyl-3-methyl-5-hydroxy-6-metoxy-1,4-benzoquinol methylase